MTTDRGPGPDAVLFDVDGTLIDSNDLHAEAWATAFAHFGFDIPVAQVRSQIGKGGDNLVPALIGTAQDERCGDALRAWRGDLFKRDYLERVRAFPDVCALFERLRGDGVRIALASSAKGDELDHYVALLGCGGLVDATTTADDVDHSKPDPDIFAAALARLGVAPDRAVVVGDTPYDVSAAKKAGIATVALRSGGFPEEDLRGAGCVALYDDVSALLAGYAGSPLKRG